MHSRTKITVRYAETDKMGIAHHSVYPVWYEVGRTDYIKMFGMTYTQVEEAGVLMPLTNLNCSFILPARYEDNLIIRTKVMTLSAARISFSYSVKKINDDQTETELGYGVTEHGFIDKNTFRPCNLKKRLPQLYEQIKATL
ncbi:MAG: thioesterase family protein [Oscillospiraceae bacterium]|nr:thioesterase family protein [Oscillospiraceae bacterium]